MSESRPARAFSSPSKISSKDLQKELQCAVTSALGGGPAMPYKKAAVVLIHFENDSIGVVDLENELAATFQEFYGITDIERVELLQEEDPNAALHTKLFELMSKGHTEKNWLIILIFSGHGESVQTPSIGNQSDSYTLLLKQVLKSGFKHRC